MKHIFILAGLLLTISSFAQKTKNAPAKNIVVGFWNVENLYDTINDPAIDDEEFLPTSASKWGTERYNKKLKNISSVIAQMGSQENADGPAILGMAEIENKKVLEDLVNTPALKSKKYQIVQYNSPDHRGIDVALLYNPKYFKLMSSKTYKVVLPGDSAKPTRDELLVIGKLNGDLVNIIVCHWPSRRGGDESAVNREAAAKVACGIKDSLLKKNPNAKIFIMGDLNDDPTDVSVKKIIGTAPEPTMATGNTMYNPMENILAGGQGTLSYKGKWNLFDQIMISPSLAVKGKAGLGYVKAAINNLPETRETDEKYKDQPLRTFVGKKYLGGYSDHFGVYVVLN